MAEETDHVLIAAGAANLSLCVLYIVLYRYILYCRSVYCHTFVFARVLRRLLQLHLHTHMQAVPATCARRYVHMCNVHTAYIWVYTKYMNTHVQCACICAVQAVPATLAWVPTGGATCESVCVRARARAREMWCGCG